MKPIDWPSLHHQLGGDLHGYTVFVETRDGRLRRMGSKGAESKKVVALAAAWGADGEMASFESSEEQARELLERLSRHADIVAQLRMGRDPEIHIGFYVSVRPRRAEDDDHVLYNGVRVSSDWPQRVEEAQTEHEYVIGGQGYPRIRYGEEADATEPVPEPCHDCAVLRGQYHVGPLCDMEECPRCHGQVIGCDCPYNIARWTWALRQRSALVAWAILATTLALFAYAYRLSPDSSLGSSMPFLVTGPLSFLLVLPGAVILVLARRSSAALVLALLQAGTLTALLARHLGATAAGWAAAAYFAAGTLTAFLARGSDR